MNAAEYTKKNRDAFFQSDEWKSVRYSVIRRDGAKCAACGRSPANGVIIHVDHIKPISLHWELRTDPENLQVLCRECNIGKSNVFEDDWRICSSNSSFDRSVVITYDMLLSISGSKKFPTLTKSQAIELGLGHPLRSGWIERLVGTRVSLELWGSIAKIRTNKNIKLMKRRELNNNRKA